VNPGMQDAGRAWAKRKNLALLTDFYQLTMMKGYWKHGHQDRHACFEYFFRDLPPNSGFAVAAGLEQLLDFLENLSFTQDDLDYLAGLDRFDGRFLDFLRGFRIQGSIQAVPEGRVVFPNEPLLRVEAPLSEAQFLETAILNSLNYATLIATKMARVRLAANDDSVMEFGLRRAQGPDGGVTGSRAAYIGGADATSNVLAGKLFGVPLVGTHAHSWVMNFESELQAFRAYAEAFPDSCLLLVDTYDTLTSGLPNALTVFRELRDAGHDVRAAVRLDSGDLARLSKAAYEMFTEAGFEDPLIVASNELDEEIIADLKRQKAKINSWGIGTHLITSSNCPALGGVYKLTAVREEDGTWAPRMKLSSNVAKMTDPGRKKVIRYFDRGGHALADVLYSTHERPQPGDIVPYVSRQNLSLVLGLTGVASAEDLMVPVMEEGKRLEPSPSLQEIRTLAQREIDSLPEEYRRLRNPEIYRIGLSPLMAECKTDLVRKLPGVLTETMVGGKTAETGQETERS